MASISIANRYLHTSHKSGTKPKRLHVSVASEHRPYASPKNKLKPSVYDVYGIKPLWRSK